MFLVSCDPQPRAHATTVLVKYIEEDDFLGVYSYCFLEWDSSLYLSSSSTKAFTASMALHKISRDLYIAQVLNTNLFSGA